MTQHWYPCCVCSDLQLWYLSWNRTEKYKYVPKDANNAVRDGGRTKGFKWVGWDWMGWKYLGGAMLRAPCQLSRAIDFRGWGGGVSENDHHKLLISSDSAFITDFSPHGLHLVQLTNYKANRERIFHFSWTTKCVYWVVSFFLLDPNVLLDHTSSCCLVHIQFWFFYI